MLRRIEARNNKPKIVNNEQILMLWFDSIYYFSNLFETHNVMQ